MDRQQRLIKLARLPIEEMSLAQLSAELGGEDSKRAIAEDCRLLNRFPNPTGRGPRPGRGPRRQIDGAEGREADTFLRWQGLRLSPRWEWDEENGE